MFFIKLMLNMAAATKKKTTKTLISSRFKFNKLSVTALAAVLAVAGVVYVFSSHASNGVTYFHGHCKDNLHLQPHAVPKGATLVQAADVVITQQQATSTTECVNDTTYRGSIYTFVIKGKSGLNMEPSGAICVVNAFAAAAAKSQNIELRHTDNKKFIVFNNFSAAAAGVVANELAAYGVSGTDPCHP